MSVIINEIQLASELAHKVTVDYILSDKELFLHYDTEDDLLVDDNGVLIYQDDVQEVFNAYYDYFISKILECSSKMSIDIVENECCNEFSRDIGSIFEYKNKKLIVERPPESCNISGTRCDFCFFNKDECCLSSSEITGVCNGYGRPDGYEVIFKEYKED